MSNYPPNNPFSAPQYTGQPNPGPPNHQGGSNAKILAPAICLLVAAILGFGFSLFNFIYALVANPVINPADPEWLQQLHVSATTRTTAIVQGALAIWNTIIVFGSIQMLRLKSKGWGIAASIMSMVNFGTLCCILGFPFGIWSLIILSLADVSQKFEIAKRR